MNAPTARRLAPEGLHPDFVRQALDRIRRTILPRAEAYFAGPDASEQPADAPVVGPVVGQAPPTGEPAVRFYDYYPCCVSSLAALARDGDARALAVTRQIVANTLYFLDTWRAREGTSRPVRRLQLHLVQAYERLREQLSTAEAAAWRALLERTATEIVAHFDAFQERVPALDNRAFGTGINHVAICAEGVWRTGDALGRPDWQRAAAGFVHRLVSYAHPDGYFEEHANDAREGGPSLNYTLLTAGCSHLVQRWQGLTGETAVRRVFARHGATYRSLVDTQLRPLAFADERANPSQFSAYGAAIHSLTAEGRGLLRLLLDPQHGLDLATVNLENLGRLALELEHCDDGEGETPEPFHDGAFRLTLPLGVVRDRGWTMGLSALAALNRDILPHSRWALDRQTLIWLAHERAGPVLCGAKSKDDPRWSTVRRSDNHGEDHGDDAYPVRTGALRIESDRATARVFFQTFTVEVTWVYGDEPRLVLASPAAGPLMAQLVLETPPGAELILNRQRHVRLGDREIDERNVWCAGNGAWEVLSPTAGRLRWPISPFNPYASAPSNASPPEARRSVFIVEWSSEIELRFGALGG